MAGAAGAAGATGRPEQDLPQLEALLRRLAREYDLFLNGQERKPPEDTERQVAAIVRAYATRPIQNPTLNFKYTSLVARYNSHRNVWARRLREREEGRGLGTALARAAQSALAEQRPKHHLPTLGAARPDEYLSADPQHEQRRLQAFYETYRKRREELGESVEKLKPDSFYRALADKIEKIKKDQGCEAVLLRLVTDGGKTRLVAKPFRRVPGKAGETP